MKNIVVFGASNSRNSVNQQLAQWAGNQIENATVKVLDLNDYEMPIYGVDKEMESGIPAEATQFLKDIEEADALVISFAEHNGNYSAAYKNIFDWASRADRSVYKNKPTFVMSTSPGPGGAGSVINIAKGSLPYAGAEVKGSFSLPSFGQNFSAEEGIVEGELKAKFDAEFSNFKEAVYETSIEA
ncbi:NADPH-dependent FMN reductase [Flammeovirga sp. EKP202]|uniref:NADPH-dependent FMN reductase n=1 Tax=Flammeovirga sp. EKP202 TaxID=2770592 RepID=UPI00165FB85F|nr:NAD(P)H-dependent oxidoreductase [Flammeovirga sp. EKP202]MBD0402767.1 NAD(P)H-dependent oxidoreductase [Flammeovirga sp. EKP202]